MPLAKLKLLHPALPIPQASTACFLCKFFWALPPGEQAYFGCLPFVFVAHIAWRWHAQRHYLAWRSLSAAFWVMEPLLPRPCWRGWALSTAENALPLLAPGRWWLTRAAGAHQRAVNLPAGCVLRVAAVC